MKLFISLIILLILFLNFGINVDEKAMLILDESFNRAMSTFGLAKALNAIISLIQGTELSLTPVGIGMNFSIGEVLDPFNDMVERFSWVMLFSSVSLGLEKLLLILSSKIFLQVALGMSGLISLFFLWIKKIKSTLFLEYSFKVFALLIMLRFTAIIFVYSSQYVYTNLLQTEYNQAAEVITETKVKLEDIQTQNKKLLEVNKSSGFFDSVDSKYKDIISSLNISKQLDTLKESIDATTKNIITMITVFVFQTVLMPLLFLWIFIFCTKFIFKYKANEEILKLLYNSENI